jgi:hypothetical protein
VGGGEGAERKGILFASFVWCGEWTVHCSISTWTVDSQLSMHALANVVLLSPILVGTRDGRTQSARAWLFFSLHLDGLKTPIYTQTIVK